MKNGSKCDLDGPRSPNDASGIEVARVARFISHGDDCDKLWIAESRAMTKEEAKAYLERYELVNEITAEEARRMSFEEKLRLTTILYLAAKDFGWQEKLREGEEEVWERWQILREKLGCLGTKA